MASCDWKKYQGGTKTKAIFRHCESKERLKREHSNTDINKKRTWMNQKFDGFEGGYKGICKAYDDYIKQLDSNPNRNKRKDRVTCVGLEIPIPAGMPDDMARNWCTDVYNAIHEKLEDRVLGGVSHFDEIHKYRDPETKEIKTSRTHLHIYVIPDVDGKLNAKKFTCRSNMVKMNNLIESVTKESYTGFKFQTGTKKKSRKTVEELKNDSDYAEIIAQAEEEAARILQEAQNKVDADKKLLDDDRKALEDEKQQLKSEKENFTLEQKKWKEEANKAIREAQRIWVQQKRNALVEWQREADEFKEKVNTAIKETYEASYRNSLQLYQEIQDRKKYEDYKKIVSEMNRSGMTFKGEPILEYFKKKSGVTFNSPVSPPPVMVEKPSVRRFTFSEDDDSKNNDFDDFLF